jgi:hypothetical protein
LRDRIEWLLADCWQLNTEDREDQTYSTAYSRVNLCFGSRIFRWFLQIAATPVHQTGRNSDGLRSATGMGLR